MTNTKMPDTNRIIKVSGCHSCPYSEGSNYCRHPDVIWGRLAIDKNAKNKTIHPDCPLDKQEDKSDLIARNNDLSNIANDLEYKLQEAEARLKTCLAVREDELYYARLDAVKHIKIAQNLHKNKNFTYQSKPALICIVESLLYAIKADLGEGNKK